ncbi:unnamed protein product [Auanema sp. JU1783]|nr:unnamed protein product [Auanema sp. JU1783]
MSAGNISIFCPYCRYHELSSPEQLCHHIVNDHKLTVVIHKKQFDDHTSFHNWLSSVEIARADGGFLASDDVDASTDESEYYLLCRQRDSPLLKRRRLVSAFNGRRQYDRINVVSCTAFVHVEYEADGSVNVLYCLDHCYNCESGNKGNIQKISQKRTKAKRSFECLSTETSDTQTVPCCSSSTSVDDDMIDEITEEVKPDTLDFSREKENDICYDISLMNKMITQRLDNTANRLRALTQLLADLAVDIRACDPPVKATVFI